MKIPKNLKVEIKCHYLGLRLRCGACGWVRFFSTDVDFACLRAVRHSQKCLSLKMFVLDIGGMMVDPKFRTKKLNSGFKATTDTDSGSVTFGLSRNRVWVTVTRFDGESFCSLDNPTIACRLAAAWLDKEFWPAFASHLHPDNTVSDAQNKLF